MELPREAFASRFAKDRIPVSATMSTGRGLGRIAVEFCAMLPTKGAALDADVRARLGDELMDVLALAFDSAQGKEPLSEQTVQKARLRFVKAWLEDHLCEPDPVSRPLPKAMRSRSAIFTPSSSSTEYPSRIGSGTGGWSGATTCCSTAPMTRTR
jgi:hypothetical protein